MRELAASTYDPGKFAAEPEYAGIGEAGLWARELKIDHVALH